MHLGIPLLEDIVGENNWHAAVVSCFILNLALDRRKDLYFELGEQLSLDLLTYPSYATGERVVARLRKQLFAAIVVQEIGFFGEHNAVLYLLGSSSLYSCTDKTRTGELTNRLSADTVRYGHPTCLVFSLRV